MALAYHAIFSAYGFWRPNDPRGSWSEFVASWEILRYGKPVHANTRISVARRSHDIPRRLEAKRALLRRPVSFNAVQIQEIAAGFGEAVDASGYEILACAIMPDHVHVVVGGHPQAIERMVGHLKGRASRRVVNSGRHPFGGERNPAGEVPSPWSENCWKVFLDNSPGITRAIRYVNDNPLREGLPAQLWPFVSDDPAARRGG